MLCLMRKQNEEIRIGERGDIRIIVLRVDGNRALLGVEAPGLPVHRLEVFERMQAQKEASDGD